jgi:hypothetical protein
VPGAKKKKIGGEGEEGRQGEGGDFDEFGIRGLLVHFGARCACVCLSS